MAAAIILIPEMLSGPPRQFREEEPVRVAGDPGLKTFTIDLTRPPGSLPAAGETANERPGPAESAPPTRTEPPAQSPPQPRDEAAPESRADSSETRPVGTPQPVATSPKPAPASAPTPVARAPERSSPPPAATAGSAGSGSGWAVQLGSFANRETAERMAADLRARNHDSFVMPVKSGAQTLYRVRIGPMPQRAAAEAELRKVQATAPGAAVVAHP